MKKKNKKVFIILSAVFACIAVFLFVLRGWYVENFGDISFTQVIFTVLNPEGGAGGAIINDAAIYVFPTFIAIAAAYICFCYFVLFKKDPVFKRITAGTLAFIISLGLFVFSAWLAIDTLNIPEYLSAQAEAETTDNPTIYETSYISPDDVDIVFPDEKQNLILIYLESMEAGFASVEEGGIKDTNYMPNLTKLAKENISFSSKETGGGFFPVDGSAWTIAALLCSSAGVAFDIPVDCNDMSEATEFLPNLTTLGDILHSEGYTQMFLCGSDAVFGGRKLYFENHGYDMIYDIHTAREEGYIPEDYYVWWGFEDQKLFTIAKDQLTELAASDQPFNFTMLTVDTHHVDGYVCELCENEYDQQYSNVIACSDRQVTEFVDWIKEQDFYEDTTIVIVGDHPYMDTSYMDGIDCYYRDMYNCFINAEAEPKRDSVFATTLDLFPTILASLGVDIQGDKLGLGVNLFSDELTLAEELTHAELNHQLRRENSEYYMDIFG